jgi:hypothetical protein
MLGCRSAAFVVLLACCATLFASFSPRGTADAQATQGPLSILPESVHLALSSENAGAPADLSLSFEFATAESGRALGDLRTAVFELPPGFAGYSQAVPSCDQAEFLSGVDVPECAPASQVGTVSFEGQVASIATRATLPLYNLQATESGLPAELGFRFASFDQLLPLTVQPQDGSLAIAVRDIESDLGLRSVSVHIWGVPGASIHDGERGRWCTSLGEGEPSCQGGEEPAQVPPRPFLTNPTSCGSVIATLRADSWEEPQIWSTVTAEAGPLVECQALEFEPSAEIVATSGGPESLTGLTVLLDLGMGQGEPEGGASAALKAATIALPAGFSLNPAFAAGLESCTPAELADELAAVPPAGGGCPEASVVGSVEARSPIAAERVSGRLYLTGSFEPATGDRVALDAVVGTAAGVRLELPVWLELAPATGQVTAVIEEAPQIPVEELALRLGSTAVAPLAAPPSCRPDPAEVTFTSWSAPSQPLQPEAVPVRREGAEAPCSSLSPLPFAPRLRVDSEAHVPGANSPISLSLTREEGEAPLEALSFRLPRGVSPRLSGVAVCPDAAIGAAVERSAASELAHPSCPEASHLGGVLIEVGAGAPPGALAGQIYLAGPHGGSPLSVALLTPILLGPFDLGTAVARAALGVDPHTGALIVGPAALPTVFDGIPLRIRRIGVDLDRPDLIRNPTSCRPLAAGAIAYGGAGEGPGRTVALHQRYRLTGCRRLRFAPRLRLGLLGSAGRNAHPGLRAVYTSHSDEATLARASFSLPGGLLLDPTRLAAPCGPRGLAALTCPAQSVVGWSRATSPLLDEPLHGPVYLARDPNGRLPALVADLGNRDLHLQVAQRLRLGPAGVRAVVEAPPDLPVSKLVLVLAGGSRGLLVDSVDLCRVPRQVAIRLVGRNGRVRKRLAPLRGPCPKHTATRPSSAVG